MVGIDSGGILVDNDTIKINDDGQAYVDSGSLIPVGCIIPFLKSYTNTPSLPAGFVECNGQTLSDSDSVFNGQVIPDLNGQNYFLRGSSTSGTTGGSEQHNLAHSHVTTSYSATINTIPGGSPDGRAYTDTQLSTIDNKPPYYEVVYVMRVK